MNFNCSNSLDMRKPQEKLKKVLLPKIVLTFHCLNKLFWWSQKFLCQPHHYSSPQIFRPSAILTVLSKIGHHFRKFKKKIPWLIYIENLLKKFKFHDFWSHCAMKDIKKYFAVFDFSRNEPFAKCLGWNATTIIWLLSVHFQSQIK